MELTGKNLSTFLRYYSNGKQFNFTFKHIDKKFLYIKLLSIDGKDIYSFSNKYHQLITSKEIDKYLATDEEYYIYRQDIDKFNNMTSKEQIDYLTNVKYNGDIIGISRSYELQTKLRNLITTDFEYTAYITKSDETNYPWIHLLNAPEEISIFTQSMLYHSDNFTIEVDDGIANTVLTKVLRHELNNKPTLYKTCSEFINNINSSGNIIRARITDGNEKDQFFKRYDIYHKNNEGSGAEILCTIAFINDGGIYAKFFIPNKIQSKLDTDIKFDFIKTPEYFKNNMHRICDFYREHQEYYKIADILESYI